MDEQTQAMVTEANRLATLGVKPANPHGTIQLMAASVYATLALAHEIEHLRADLAERAAKR